jgi:hypothetical protein
MLEIRALREGIYAPTQKRRLKPSIFPDIGLDTDRERETLREQNETTPETETYSETETDTETETDSDTDTETETETDSDLETNLETDLDIATHRDVSPATDDDGRLHTFTPDELRHLMQLLNVSDNDTDLFTQLRHHLAGKFCRCVTGIRAEQNGKPSQYPPEQTCRYSVFNRRGLASHKISCWDEVDGKSTYNPQLLPGRRKSVALSKGPLWTPTSTSPRVCEPSSMSCVGIKNDSATCYMNSALQMLYSMTTIRECVNAPPIPCSELGVTSDEYRRVLDMTAVLSQVFAKLAGTKAVRALSAHDHHFYRAINDSMSKQGQIRIGQMGSADEVLGALLDILGDLYPAAKVEFSIAETSYSVCDAQDAVLRDVNVMVALPFVTPDSGCGNVQGLVDQMQMHVFVDGEISGCEKSKGHAYVKYELYTAADESRSKFVVVPVRRQRPIFGGEVFRKRFDTSNLQPGIITLGHCTYSLVGAILYAKRHYVFVRTRGAEVVRLYSDDVVYSSERAVAFMRETKLDINRNATVLLYQRTCT